MHKVGCLIRPTRGTKVDVTSCAFIAQLELHSGCRSVAEGMDYRRLVGYQLLCRTKMRTWQQRAKLQTKNLVFNQEPADILNWLRGANVSSPQLFGAPC